MKTLGVKFSEAQSLEIKHTAEIVNVLTSKVARAAMRLGLMQIDNMANKDVKKALDLVLVNDARSK